MSRMIQIRNVGEEVHRQLKARAALAGMSLSEYLLQRLKRDLERPTREELLNRLRQRQPADPGEPIAAALAEERSGR